MGHNVANTLGGGVDRARETEGRNSAFEVSEEDSNSARSRIIRIWGPASLLGRNDGSLAYQDRRTVMGGGGNSGAQREETRWGYTDQTIEQVWGQGMV